MPTQDEIKDNLKKLVLWNRYLNDPDSEKADSKEQSLETLTDDKLEEVTKKPVEKALWETWLDNRQLPLWHKLLKGKVWHDGTLTPENLARAFNVESGKKNVDAIGSSQVKNDELARAVDAVSDTLRNVKGGKRTSSDKKITYGSKDKTVSEIADAKMPSGMKNLLEGAKMRQIKNSANVEKVSMGDPSKGNQHENTAQNTNDDIIDDEQIYIGKPSKQGKVDKHD